MTEGEERGEEEVEMAEEKEESEEEVSYLVSLGLSFSPTQPWRQLV